MTKWMKNSEVTDTGRFVSLSTVANKVYKYGFREGLPCISQLEIMNAKSHLTDVTGRLWLSR